MEAETAEEGLRLAQATPPALFDGYQAKPIEVTQFVAAVRDAVGGPATGTVPA